MSDISPTDDQPDSEYVRIELPKNIYVKVKGTDGGFVEIELPREVYTRRSLNSENTHATESAMGGDDSAGNVARLYSDNVKAEKDNGHDVDRAGEESVSTLSDSSSDTVDSPVIDDSREDEAKTQVITAGEMGVRKIMDYTEVDFDLFTARLDWRSTKKSECPACLQTFNDPHRLKLHMKKLHVRPHNNTFLLDSFDSKIKIRCPVCKRLFVDEARLATHVRKFHHPDTYSDMLHDAKRILVNTTKKLEKVKKVKKLEKIRYDRNGKRIYFAKDFPGGKFPKELTVCTVCNKDMKLPSHLRLHMIQHTKEKSFNCALCDRSFGYHSQLKVHMRSHTGEKPYCCSFCGKEFSSVSCLKEHKKIHGDKNIMCEECGQSFKTTSVLRSHRFTHASERPHHCELCPMTFKEINALSRHRQRHTQVKRDKVCDLCNMAFYDPIVLRQHRFIHTQEKKHECGVCHKKFLRPYNLSVHMRIHTGSKPYKCSRCEQTFSQLAGLKSHNKSHGHADGVS